MLLSILNKFIFKSISLRVIIMRNNSFKCKDYETNLAKNNEKNNLHYVIKFISINELKILNSYIYIDVNKFR